jgi:hypothetical protein
MLDKAAKFATSFALLAGTKDFRGGGEEIAPDMTGEDMTIGKIEDLGIERLVEIEKRKMARKE